MHLLRFKPFWAALSLPSSPFDVALLVEVHVALPSGDNSAVKSSFMSKYPGSKVMDVEDSRPLLERKTFDALLLGSILLRGQGFSQLHKTDQRNQHQPPPKSHPWCAAYLKSSPTFEARHWEGGWTRTTLVSASAPA